MCAGIYCDRTSRAAYVVDVHNEDRRMAGLIGVGGGDGSDTCSRSGEASERSESSEA